MNEGNLVNGQAYIWMRVI